DRLERSLPVVGFPRAVANANRFKRISGLTWRQMLTEGRAMRKTGDLSWSQVLMAANTPMLLKATMVDGRVDAGVMASGQVVGLIDDLPSAKDVVERILGEAEAVLARLASGEPASGHCRRGQPADSFGTSRPIARKPGNLPTGPAYVGRLPG